MLNYLNIELLTTSRVGRASIYTPLLMSLNPRVCHTAATITNFADKMGISHRIFHKKDLERRATNSRIRIALGRRRADYRFPLDGDGKTYTNGRYYTGWYGWRWQGFDGCQDALDTLAYYLEPLMISLASNQKYNLVMLYQRWESMTSEWDDMTSPFLGKLNSLNLEGLAMIQARLSLYRYAAHRGLDPRVSYPANCWRMPPIEQAMKPEDLRPLFVRVAPNQMYGSHDIVEQAFADSLFTIDTDPNLLRFSLTCLEENHSFPEDGDQLQHLGERLYAPRWYGARWLKAMGLD